MQKMVHYCKIVVACLAEIEMYLFMSFFNWVLPEQNIK